jgi:hypothetical protein
MADLNINISPLIKKEMGNVTFTVKPYGLDGWYFRWKIATLLIRLASWIAGAKYEEEAK